MSEVFNIFEIPVLRKKLNIDNNKIISYVHKLKKNDTGNILSNEGGYQSSILSKNFDTSLKLLVNDIENIGNEMKEHLNLIGNLKIDTLWANINEYKDFNIAHIHSGVFSGVYYVKTPENCGNIVFEHPIIDVMNISWKRKLYNKQNSAEWWLPSEESLLYIFPSWLRHYVKPNLNKEEERISISFNLSD